MTDGTPENNPQDQPPASQPPTGQPPPGWQPTGPAPDPYGLGPTSLGMSANIAAGLSYFFWPILPLIFFVLEKQNRFVKFHSMQSLLFGLITIPLWVLYVVLMFIPLLGWLLIGLIALGVFAYWVYLLVMAFTGQWTKAPFIGDVAARQVGA